MIMEALLTGGIALIVGLMSAVVTWREAIVGAFIAGAIPVVTGGAFGADPAVLFRLLAVGAVGAACGFAAGRALHPGNRGR